MININKIKKDIENKLYSYTYMEYEIEELNKMKEKAKSSDVNSWIKSKGQVSSSVEKEIIKNIDIDKKIEKIQKWKNLIYKIMKHFEENENEKYRYIILKYFRKMSVISIEIKMALPKSTQFKIRDDIILAISLLALKEDIISLE